MQFVVLSANEVEEAIILGNNQPADRLRGVGGGDQRSKAAAQINPENVGGNIGELFLG